MANILIFGDLRDPHVTSVRNELQLRGDDVFVFSRYDRHCRINLNYSQTIPSIQFRINDLELNGKDVHSVWWRQKPFQLYFPDHPDRNATEQFVGREWHALLNCLTTFLPQARWMNTIEIQQRANLKPNQFIWAIKSGFAVPPTVFTNDIEAVRGMLQSADAVYKTFSGFIFPEASAIFTTRVVASDLINANDRIGIAPGIYQNYINKLFEVRIYFVGENILTIKIDSQANNITQTDWRKDQSLAIYEQFQLEAADSGKVLRFADTSGLKFGAIDGIVTTSGELYFLECNPAGQWLWLQDFTRAPITEAVAEYLHSCPQGLVRPNRTRSPEAEREFQHESNS